MARRKTLDREHVLSRLLEMAGNRFDPETAHAEADDLLLALVDDDEVREAYDAIHKWYA